MLRIPSGAAAPEPPVPPSAWDEVWESEDATYSGGELVSIVGRLLGLTWVPSVGYEPLEGAATELNGIAGIQFGTDRKRLELVEAEVLPGSFTAWTVEVVRWQDNKDGVQDRQYEVYVANNSSSAPDHIVFPEQANILGFNTRGMFVGPDWYYNDNSAPTSFPEVATWTFDTDTSIAYSNGIQDGDPEVGSAKSMEWADLYWGGSYGDYTLSNVQWAKGPRYSLRIKLGTAMTAAEVLTEATERMTRFGATNFNHWDPSQRTLPLVGWCDQRGKRDFGTVQWPGGSTPCYQWDGNAFSGEYIQNNDSATSPTEGARINGHPTMAFHSGPFWSLAGGAANGAIYGYMGAGPGYDLQWDIVMTPLGATTTQATPSDQRNIIIGEHTDYFALCLFNDSGVLSASVYWWDGSNETLAVPLSGAGVPGRLRLRYDYATTTLSLQWNNGTPASRNTVNPLSSRTGLLRIGDTAFGPTGNFDWAEHQFAPGYDATDSTNQNTYNSWKYGLTL